MGRTEVEPAPLPDARLARDRRGAARVYDGDRQVANLVTRVEVWWTVEGPWWRRRHVHPVERVEWFLTFADDYEHRHSSGWADGVDADPNELDRDEFIYAGHRLRLTWLSGEIAEAHIAEHGYW